MTSLADRVLLDEAEKRVLAWVTADSLDGLRIFAGCGDDGHKPPHLLVIPGARPG